MTTGLLGVSALELRTDQTQLDQGLALARQKVDASGVAMQTSWDRRMVSMGASMRSAMSSSTGSLSAMTAAGGRMRQTTDELAGAEAAYQVQIGKGSGARRKASDETRTLAAETGVSAKAMRDLYGTLGPVGGALGDLTTRSRIYREHGIDYLTAGVVGLEGAFIASSAHAALSFAELGDEVERQTGLSGKALDDLMSTIRTVARDSPYQIQQVADAAVILRKSFGETNAEIATNANLMIAFAQQAGGQVTPVMQQLTRIVKDYREPLGDVVGLTDKLVGVSQATQQPLSSVLDTLDQYGPRLQAMGLNMNESIRLLGVFQASGIPVAQLGRGLATALGDAGTATQDGASKLVQYQIAVQTAQDRVNSLITSIATGKGDQQKYDDELLIAQERLGLAKSKYDQLDQSLKAAKASHGDISTTIEAEIKQITDAGSKQAALNLAVQDFGKNLGPSMARAFYDNQAAIEAVDKALRKHGETQHLFDIDAKTLPAELQRAKNNFQDLEIEVGEKLVPALSHGVDWIRSTVSGFDDFYKHNQDLVDIAGGILGIGSAITLLSRHSPLGNVLGRIFANSGHTNIAQFLSGKGASSGVWGEKGPAAAGSLSNPVIVALKNGAYTSLGEQAAPISETTPKAETTAVGEASLAREEEVSAAQLGLFGDSTNEKASQLELFPYREESGAGLSLTADAESAAEKTGWLSNLKGTIADGFKSVGEGALVASIGTGVAQAVGAAIGGKAGGAVSSIGTGASVGAGIGTAIEPGIGTAVGAGLGAGVSAAVHFLGGGNEGKQIADAVTSGMSKEVQKQFSSSIASALDTAKSSVTREQMPADSRFGYMNALTQPTATDRSKSTAAYRIAGQEAGMAFVENFSSVKLPTGTSMVQDFETQLSRLPTEAKESAAVVMLQYAQGLQQNGKLPAGEVTKMIASLEQQFPGFQSYLQQQGLATDRDFATALQLTQSRASLQDSINQLKQQFGYIPQDSKVTLATMTQQFSAAFSFLEKTIGDSTGATRKAAVENYSNLSTQATAYVEAMSARCIQRMDAAADGVASGSAAAARTVVENFGEMSKGITWEMNQGLVSTQKGAKMLAEGLNAQLKALGQKPLPISVESQVIAEGPGYNLSVQSASGYSLPATSGGMYTAAAGGAATGALYQIGRAGDRGGDTIPLSVGGTNIMVGSGEKVAVFNADQQAAMDRLAAPVGGLAGVFSRFNRRHDQTPRYAGGGMLPGYAAGGTLTYGQLEQLWDEGNPDLKQDDALMAAIAMAESGGRDVVNSIGASGYWQIYGLPFPGDPLDPLTDARMAGAKLRSQGLDAWVTYQTGAFKRYLNGAMPSGLTAAASIAQLAAPKVKGSGALASLAQAGLDKLTSAANAFLETRSVTGVGAGGSGVGGAYAGSGKASALYDPGQLETFDGKPVARWIVPELEWAREHGWAGSVTSGWRSPTEVVHGVFATAEQGHSEHQYDVYPGGAVDVSDYEQFAQIISAYTGADKLIQLGIDPLHFSGTGHARGGIVPIHAARGLLATIRPDVARASAPKATKIAKPLTAPKIKTPTGFPTTYLSQLTSIDSLISGVENWQSLIESMHGMVAVSPTITDSSGNTVLNPGSLNAVINTLTGLNDPTTGQPTKGIYDRLREIGTISDRVNPSSPTLQDTELGLEETLLGLYLSEQPIASAAMGQYTPWLQAELASQAAYTKMRDYIIAALNPDIPMSKMPAANFSDFGNHIVAATGKYLGPDAVKIVSWGSTIREKAQELRNTYAQIARLKKLQEELPNQRRDRETALTNRFTVARANIENSGTSTTFSSSQLLSDQLSALDSEQQSLSAQIGTSPPSGWVGDAESWAKQAGFERDQLSTEYTDRKKAVKKAFEEQKYAASLKKAKALLALQLEESTDKTALADAFTTRTQDLSDQVTGQTSTRTSDKKLLNEFLSKIKSTISSETTAISTAENDTYPELTAYVSPTGQLAINVATAQNIDIPSLLSEVSQLTGTTVSNDTTTTADQSSRISLLQQQVGTLGQELAIAQADNSAFKSLGSLPPFGGVFHTGGIVPGPVGAERVVIAQGGEEISTLDQQRERQQEGQVVHVHETHVHVHEKTPGFAAMIQTEVKKATTQKTIRPLPGAGGGWRRS